MLWYEKNGMAVTAPRKLSRSLWHEAPNIGQHGNNNTTIKSIADAFCGIPTTHQFIIAYTHTQKKRRRRAE
jgi:hypothetical protein